MASSKVEEQPNLPWEGCVDEEDMNGMEDGCKPNQPLDMGQMIVEHEEEHNQRMLFCTPVQKAHVAHVEDW
jgi:hypothetical protein